VDWKDEEGDGESQQQEQPSFPEFSAKVQQVLRSFGGQMFCKLNWSSPKAGSPSPAFQ
jgi:D123